MRSVIQAIDLIDLTREAVCIEAVNDRQSTAVVRGHNVFVASGLACAFCSMEPVDAQRTNIAKGQASQQSVQTSWNPV